MQQDRPIEPLSFTARSMNDAAADDDDDDDDWTDADDDAHDDDDDDDDWADAVSRQETSAAAEIHHHVDDESDDVTSDVSMDEAAERSHIWIADDEFPHPKEVKKRYRVLKTIDVNDDLTIVVTSRSIYLQNNRDGRPATRLMNS